MGVVRQESSQQTARNPKPCMPSAKKYHSNETVCDTHTELETGDGEAVADAEGVGVTKLMARTRLFTQFAT